MWDSPIKQIADEMNMVMEGEIMKVVQRYGFDVDKEELIKALAYDRNQYEKGYADGYAEAEEQHRWIPCSERLPEEEQCVLAQVTSEYQFSVGDETDRIVLKYDTRVAGFSWKEIGFDAWLADEVVIAWQPLPPKYEPKEDKQK